MADFKIQRGVIDFGATEDALDVAITAVDLDYAFVRITDAMRSTSGPTAGTTANRYVDDLSAYLKFKDADELTITRFGTGENVDYRVHWEIVEYVGPAGGPNEFIVRDHALGLAISGTTATIAVTGHDDITQVVPIICSYANNGTGLTTSQMTYTAKVLTGTDEVEYERGVNSGRWVQYAAHVEFTGSNWVIEQNVESSLSSVHTNDVTITDVGDWSHAWVEFGFRAPSGGNSLQNSTKMWWPHPSSTTVARFGLGQGAASQIGYYGIGHVIRNDAITVDHYDSVDGGETTLAAGTSSPQAVDFTISSVGPDLGAISCWGFVNTAGTGTAYPRQFCGYRLKDATTVEFWRGRHGNVREFSLSLIRSPITLTPDPATATSSAPATTLDVPRTLAPGAASAALTAPAVTLDRPVLLRPQPATATLTPPATTLDRPLTILGGVPEFNLDANPVQLDRPVELQPGPAQATTSAPAVTLDRPVLLRPQPATAALSAPAATVRVEVRLSPAPAIATLAAPATTLELGIILQPDPATFVLAAATVRGTLKTLVPDPAVLSLAAPAVSLSAYEIQPTPAVLVLTAPPALLLIPGRPMLEAELAVLEALEHTGTIGQRIEQEGALAATLEPALGIGPALEAELAIAETIEAPAP